MNVLIAEGTATRYVSAENTIAEYTAIPVDEHVVGPHQEADRGDREARHRDEAVAEDALAGEAGDDLADHPHRGQDHDVDGGVRVEPEEVLEEDRVAAPVGVEEAEVEDPLQGHQEEGDRDHRRPQDLDDRGRVVRPHEEGHPEPRHPRRPHLVDGHDEVEPGEDRGEAGDEDAHRGELDVALREHRAVGRVEGPARVEPAGEQRVERDRRPDHVDVPAQQVELREGQVLRPDHQRDQEVPERGRDRRDQEEEHHDHAVPGEGLL